MKKSTKNISNCRANSRLGANVSYEVKMRKTKNYLKKKFL